MSKFVKVKFEDCRYTEKGGNDIYLNIDNVVVFDEHENNVYTTSGQIFRISDDSIPVLIETLKRSEQQ